MKIIPFDPTLSSYQTFSVNLGDFVASFRLLWNERDGSWYMDVDSDIGKNSSVRLVPDSPLLGRFNRLGYEGDFRCLKTDASATNSLGYDQLGSAYSLVWGTATEWESYDGV